MAVIHVPDHYDHDEPYFERLRHHRHGDPAPFPNGRKAMRRKRRKAHRAIARDVRSAHAALREANTQRVLASLERDRQRRMEAAVS